VIIGLNIWRGYGLGFGLRLRRGLAKLPISDGQDRIAGPVLIMLYNAMAGIGLSGWRPEPP